VWLGSQSSRKVMGLLEPEAHASTIQKEGEGSGTAEGPFG